MTILSRLTELTRIITSCEAILKMMDYYEGTPYAATQEERQKVLKQIYNAEQERAGLENKVQQS